MSEEVFKGGGSLHHESTWGRVDRVHTNTSVENKCHLTCQSTMTGLHLWSKVFLGKIHYVLHPSMFRKVNNHTLKCAIC